MFHIFYIKGIFFCTFVNRTFVDHLTVMADGVKIFLRSLGLEHYFQIFQLKGYDDEADITHLSASDLHGMEITQSSDVSKILKAARKYKESSEYRLLRWLRTNGLCHYYEGFVKSGIVRLNDVANLDLPDEDLFDELEITLPGHKKRLEYAVCTLREEESTLEDKGQSESTLEENDEKELVTEGWWGFPSYLPSAKFPFLCVQALVRSTRPSSTSKSISFMVDSGSDVSTLRGDIIKDLNLEAVMTVRSCGAYGSQRTTMYKAYITIGDCILETEVIASTYDSVGSRVLRNFHHSIDDIRHKWMRIKTAGIRQAENTSCHQNLPCALPGSALSTQSPSASQTAGTTESAKEEDGQIVLRENNPFERNECVPLCHENASASTSTAGGYCDCENGVVFRQIAECGSEQKASTECDDETDSALALICKDQQVSVLKTHHRKPVTTPGTISITAGSVRKYMFRSSEECCGKRSHSAVAGFSTTPHSVDRYKVDSELSELLAFSVNQQITGELCAKKVCRVSSLTAGEVSNSLAPTIPSGVLTPQYSPAKESPLRHKSSDVFTRGLGSSSKVSCQAESSLSAKRFSEGAVTTDGQLCQSSNVPAPVQQNTVPHRTGLAVLPRQGGQLTLSTDGMLSFPFDSENKSL